jgi:hypothetical protein
MKSMRFKEGAAMFGCVLLVAACTKEKGGAGAGAARPPESKPAGQEAKPPETVESDPPVAAQVVSLKRAPSKALLELELQNQQAKEVESYKCMILMLDREGKLLEVQNRWLLQHGAKENRPLASDEKRKVNVVLDTTEAFDSVQVIPTRVILAGGEIIDPVRTPSP